jgi:hypothetical protein
MPDPQTFGLARTRPPDAHWDDATALTEPTDLADLIAEARAIVAGADIRPTRAHLAACLIWLDGGPTTLAAVRVAR